jgi:hypothetical protein
MGGVLSWWALLLSTANRNTYGGFVALQQPIASEAQVSAFSLNTRIDALLAYM